ncbi:erythromycin esterase family protein [Streptomyces sp. NPDC087212]|uniref:erythromycin esterase family protein n=1 Tax=Streptomyces sp. NPDC087212 TaxID=3365766 RepID=UPI00381AF547
MRRKRTPITLALLLSLGAAVLGTPATAATAPRPDAAVVDALGRAAHPLRTVEPGGDTRDLRALDRVIGAAPVVGLGEATHGSHEFFALKDRVFRHLVEEKGFRTFALETSWSTGLRLDAYVVHGTGELRRIMRDEFQRDYLWWNNTDYLRLIEWMRAYNVDHPGDPVRFLGDDLAWTGPEVYDEVQTRVRAARPADAARLAELYRGLRPTRATGTYIERYLNTPLAARQDMARRTGEALALVRRLPATDPADRARLVQQATAIDRTARQYAFDFEDPAQLADAMRYRDEAMAANVLWWQRHTGTKVLLSAHDAHVGLVPQDPAHYPKVQGAYLRDRLGRGYVSVGVTFGQGSFNATGPDGTIRRWTLGPAPSGGNEQLLDRVRPGDYVLDLRSVRSPARAWLAVARPTRMIGTAYPQGPSEIALARNHDVLIHLHRVAAARLR